MSNNFLVLYQSKSISVIDKPVGVTSTEVSDLICHRLDRATSGCLIIAKNKAIRKKIQQQFKKREVDKQYVAFTIGKLDKTNKVEGWLERNPKNSRLMRLSPGFVKSADEFSDPEKNRGRNKRYSKTIFHLNGLYYKKIFKSNRDQFNFFSLVKAEPVTGRMHQIRAHLDYLDRPILGDPWYNNKISKQASEKLSTSRLMLHAKKIAFLDPASQSRVEVDSKLPEEFISLKRNMIKQ